MTVKSVEKDTERLTMTITAEFDAPVERVWQLWDDPRRLEQWWGPGRFRTAKAVGAHFGLTPKRYQSGETDVTGGISKVGDATVRTALYEAANAMLTRTARVSGLKRWALEVAKRRGMRRAKVALARKLAGVLHRMWANGTDFRWGKEAAA